MLCNMAAAGIQKFAGLEIRDLHRATYIVDEIRLSFDLSALSIS